MQLELSPAVTGPVADREVIAVNGGSDMTQCFPRLMSDTAEVGCVLISVLCRDSSSRPPIIWTLWTGGTMGGRVGGGGWIKMKGQKGVQKI